MENFKKIKINKKRNIKKYLVIIFSLLLSLSLFTCGVVKDTKPPKVTSVTLPTDQLHNRVIIITFSEPIQNIILSKFEIYTGDSAGEQATSETVSSFGVSNNNQIYLILQNEVVNGYYIKTIVNDQAVSDEAGNPVIRTVLNPLRNYIDNEGPLLNGVTATTSSTISNQIIVTFNEEVKSVVSSKFRIYTGTDPLNINTPNPVTKAERNPNNPYQVIITVQNNLNPKEYVRVEIDSGAVQDNLGNNAPDQGPTTNPPILVSSTQVDQETGSDNVRPTIVDWEIAADSSEILFTFSEAVRDADISRLHVTQGASGNVNQNNNVVSAQVLTDNNHKVKVTFANTFSGGNYVKYNIEEGFVSDLSGNLISATVSTTDKQVPTVHVNNFTKTFYSISSVYKNSIELGDSEFIVSFNKAVEIVHDDKISFNTEGTKTTYYSIQSISLSSDGLSITISMRDYVYQGGVNSFAVFFERDALEFKDGKKNDSWFHSFGITDP